MLSPQLDRIASSSHCSSSCSSSSFNISGRHAQQLGLIQPLHHRWTLHKSWRVVARRSSSSSSEGQQERSKRAVGSGHSHSLVESLVQSKSAEESGKPSFDVSAQASAGVLETDGGSISTQFIAETLLPTRHGKLRLRGYKHSVDGGLTFTEPTAIIAGNVEGRENVPLRVHDACYTSEVLGSLKCDCADQLNLALRMITENPPGMVIYLQQEGRGIGLANKIAAYALQEQGLDTVDANRALGLPDDCREYTSVRNILWGLGVKSIRLITNNPRKINELKGLGLVINGRIPCIADSCNEHNEEYLQAKQERMNHLFEMGESCFWNHQEGGVALPSAKQPQERKIAKVQLPDLSGAASSVSSTQQQQAAAEQVVAGGLNARSSSPSAQ